MNTLSFQQLCPELSLKKIRKIAQESGFSKRIEKKISPGNYLSYLCQESIKGTVSYNDLAAKICCDAQCEASRQAYFYRTKEQTIEFLKAILEAVMKKKAKIHDVKKSKSIRSCFRRILFQDSTVIRLPNKLYEVFSGVKNALATRCNARIQGVYDLVARKFVFFAIGTYSDNDMKFANSVDVKPGDLVLRDRGYFTVANLKKIQACGADVISRYRHKTIFYDIHTGEEIDLLKKLKQCISLDMWVLAGPDKSVKLRILAAPAKEEVVNLRRMRAVTKGRGKKASAQLLQLLGWTIFITTIEDEKFTIEKACMLYSLRWRIESIFKSWKSEMNFTKIHNVSALQLRVLLYARFIMITILYERFYKRCEEIISLKFNKNISLFKFIRYICRNTQNFVRKWRDPSQRNATTKMVMRYCTYDNRKRLNYSELQKQIHLLT